MRSKRRRLKAPLSLVLFGWGFVLFPFINYVALAFQYRQPLTRPEFLLQPTQWPVVVIMALALAVGIGLLRVQKWGWVLFQVLAVILVGYNLYLAVVNFNSFNLGALTRAALMVAAAVFFLQKDISAPYMRMYPRGWRHEKRLPVEIPVKIDGGTYTTTDCSEAGFYVRAENPTFVLNQEVRVEIEVAGTPFSCVAGVVRLDEDGAGIAFRGLSRADVKTLRLALRHA